MIQYKPEIGAHLPERKIWLAHYTAYMTSRNKSISKIPVMGYKELDLYSLYKEVLCYGGFQKVKNHNALKFEAKTSVCSIDWIWIQFIFLFLLKRVYQLKPSKKKNEKQLNVWKIYK